MTWRAAKPLVFLLAACLTATCLCPVAGKARAAGPYPEPVVTKYMEPLKAHDAKLKKIDTEISRLLSKGEPDDSDEAKEWDKEVKAVGEKFLKEGKAFLKTVDKFLKGETRRGLMREIDLIQKNVMATHRMLVDYRRLKGIRITKVSKDGKADLKALLLRFAKAQLQKRITAKLKDEGLQRIVKSETWRKAVETAITVANEKLATEIDTHVERLVGMPFHDHRSMHRALKQRVNGVVERRIGRLLMRVTRKKVVITLGQQVIGAWMKDKLWKVVWPRIKERFREKGRHASRTARSMATMRAARMRLAGLKPTARRTRVISEMNNAVEVLLAAEHLVKDLKRARGDEDDEEDEEGADEEGEATSEEEEDKDKADAADDGEEDEDEAEGQEDDEEDDEREEAEEDNETDELFKDLSLEIALLLQTRKNTGLRFLLHKESLVMALTVDREVLADTLRELEKIIRGVEPPALFEGKMFYVHPYQVPAESGPKLAPTIPRASQCCFGFWGSLKCVDIERMEGFRERMLASGAKESDVTFDKLLKKNLHLVKDYSKAYVVRITCKGQTSFYHFSAGDSRRGVWGRASAFGLQPGRHAMAVSITTAEGARIDETLAVRVEFNEKDKKWGPWLEKRAKDLEESRKLLDELEGKKRITHAGKHLSNLQQLYLPKHAKFGGASQATVMGHLRDIMEISEVLLEGEKAETRSNSYVFYMMAVANWCQMLGSQQAYTLAKEALGKAQSKAGNLKSSEKSKIAHIHLHLANLAIATGNDVEAAKKHLEDWLKVTKESGRKMTEKDEETERKTWPKDW